MRRPRTEYDRKYRQTHPELYRAINARRRQKTKDRARALKAQPCADCGKLYPYYVMDFDHRPGETKSFGIAKYLSVESTTSSYAKLDAEMAKCDVVCANCHRERTYRRRQVS
jgi:uncharacterized OB-fold protein